ncbi:hypothetical protein T492DRAFT_879012 [Pavlovales sp. CCMP2436]|nr:hypothetical protein T492DRAFT_879012 [Pavlovales sp. CCMP2436]
MARWARWAIAAAVGLLVLQQLLMIAFRGGSIAAVHYELRSATSGPDVAPAAQPEVAQPRAARVGGDMYDEGVLLREALTVARPGPDGALDVLLVPVSRTYAHFGLNLLLNFQRLGYEHVLLLAKDEQTCEQVTALSPLPSRCVWDGRWERDLELARRASPWSSICGKGRASTGQCDETSEPAASYRMWLSRWIANARLVALGFDTLMLDLDLVLVDDVYAFLRAPPLDR